MLIIALLLYSLSIISDAISHFPITSLGRQAVARLAACRHRLRLRLRRGGRRIRQRRRCAERHRRTAAPRLYGRTDQRHLERQLPARSARGGAGVSQLEIEFGPFRALAQGGSALEIRLPGAPQPARGFFQHRIRLGEAKPQYAVADPRRHEGRDGDSGHAMVRHSSVGEIDRSGAHPRRLQIHAQKIGRFRWQDDETLSLQGGRKTIA